MVQLDHLIQQAKNRRRINDLFKTKEEGLLFRPETLGKDKTALEPLLDKLEPLVMELSNQNPAFSELFINELEDIVETLTIE